MLGISPKDSVTLLIILNALGIPGRLLPNFVSDRWLGPINTMVPFAVMSSLLIYCWMSIGSTASLIAFAVFYGFFSSGMLSLFPAALGSLSKDTSKAGVRLGMTMSCVSFTCLTGPPIGGWLIQADGGSYVAAQIFFGSVVVGGVGFLVAARIAVCGWRIALKA